MNKRKSETKPDWKGNSKNKVRWGKKWVRPQDLGNKDNVAPPKRYNASDRGHGHQSKEQNKEPVWCWTCGGDHHRRYFPHHQGGMPHIYSAEDAQTIGDVGQSIPHIYVALDNKKVDHQASIIEMEGKLCDWIVFILIDPGSNYSYVSLDLVDKCGLNK